MGRSKRKPSASGSNTLKQKAASKSEPAKEADKLRTRVRQLEKMLEQAEQHAARLKAAKWAIPTAGPSKKPRGSFTRAFITDTHGAKCDKAALAAVVEDLKVLQPKEVVLGGDMIDCGGFLGQHWTLGYVAECDATWEDDVAAGNTMLDAVQGACGDADYHYLEGNHEHRVERWCVTQALRSGQDAKWLHNMLSPSKVLHTEKRGIAYYSTNTAYHGLRIRGTIKLGLCYFTHGRRTGRYATRRILNDYAGCVVHGHTHTAGAATEVTVKDGVIGAWCPGCLCDVQPLWNHSDPTAWSHGYAVQLVRPDGSFLHINVPIIEGKSYLVQMQEAVR